MKKYPINNDVAPEIKNGPSKRISTHYVNAKALLFPPSSHGKQTVLFGFYLVTYLCNMIDAARQKRAKH